MKMGNRFGVCASVRASVIALLLCVAAGEAFSQTDFYKGKRSGFSAAAAPAVRESSRLER